MAVTAAMLGFQARVLDDLSRALERAARPPRGTGEAARNVAIDQIETLAASLQSSADAGWAKTAIREARQAHSQLVDMAATDAEATLLASARKLAQAGQGARYNAVDAVVPGLSQGLGRARRAEALMDRIIARGDSGGHSGADVAAIRNAYRGAEHVLRAAAAAPAIPVDARRMAHVHANIADVLGSSLARHDGVAYTGELGRTLDTARLFSSTVSASTRKLANRLLHELDASGSAEWAPEGRVLAPVHSNRSPVPDEAVAQRIEAAIAGGVVDDESKRIAALLSPETVKVGVPNHVTDIPGVDSSDAPLPAGLHRATWREFSERFGSTPGRQALLDAFQGALLDLRSVGVDRVHVGGSFVRSKAVPGDIDFGLVIDPHHSSDPIRDALVRHWDDGIHGYHRSTSDDFFTTMRSGADAGLVELDLADLPR